MGCVRSSFNFFFLVHATGPTNTNPDVQYWAKTDWTEYCKHARLQNEVPDKFGFLCDESGEKVSSQRLKEMSKSAMQLWPGTTSITGTLILRHRPRKLTKLQNISAIQWCKNIQSSTGVMVTGKCRNLPLTATLAGIIIIDNLVN